MNNLESLMKKREAKLNAALKQNNLPFQLYYTERFSHNAYRSGYNLCAENCNFSVLIYYNSEWWDLSDDDLISYLSDFFQKHHNANFNQDFLTRSYALSHLEARFIPHNCINDARKSGLYVDLWQDLGVTYQIPLPPSVPIYQDIESASIQVTSDVLTVLQIAETELFDSAIRCMNHNAVICTLDEMIEVLTDALPSLPPTSNTGTVFCLSNKSNYFGASMILIPSVLNEILKSTNRSFAILPSSVHELLILHIDPEELKEQLPYLQNMVQEINQSVVLKEDFLSNNIYYYVNDHIETYKGECTC